MEKPRLLSADEIEVKVKKVTEKGVVALLYKTARVDMDILDETYGPENWQDDYKEIKGNLYCGIGINEVWKWYSAPFIWIPAEKAGVMKAQNGRVYTNDKFTVEKIVYNEARKISGLSIINTTRKERVFVWQRA